MMMTRMMDTDERPRIEAQLVALRPALHRYAARMVGSALDGDVTAWLFRVAHNAAIDFLRSRARRATDRPIEADDRISDDDEAASRLATRAALSVFMQLSPSQRAAVILKDVLGYSNEEAAGILDTSLAATKAALHRGRARLRKLADDPIAQPHADPADLARLQAYVDRFNARDFDAIRAMLADEVRFELVARLQGGRPAFETYFSRYAEMTAWRLSVGTIDGWLAAIVYDPAAPGGAPTGLIVVDWADGRIVRLRDFYHARYVLEGAAIGTQG
jgi:RNA polymerase sigma-70 factor (ECF subfamily)